MTRTFLNIPMKNFGRIFVLTILVLLIPFIAMLFSSGMNWGIADFIIVGVMLLTAGFVYELLASRTLQPKNKLLVGLVTFLVVAAVYVELAVGIFD